MKQETLAAEHIVRVYKYKMQVEVVNRVCRMGHREQNTC